MEKTFAIVGIGLIGGSVALKCKHNGLATKVIGVDNNPDHCKQALELGLVDETQSLDQAIQQSDVIILAIPVGAIATILPSILDQVTDQVGAILALVDRGLAKDKGRVAEIRDHQQYGYPRRGIGIDPEALDPELPGEDHRQHEDRPPAGEPDRQR